MSEAAQEDQEAAPKKKSKLPIIIALVLLVGGGGFFIMKMKAGPAKKPEIKLSKEKPVELKEFLVNLQDKGVYCRTEIDLGLAEGADAKAVEDHEDAIRDAINLRLTSKTLAEVDNVAGLKQLKHELASDINAILATPTPDSAGETKAADDGANTKESKDAKGEPSAHPDWDSDTGPVLKIYFSSFATQ